jgi:Zn-finger nucleic acid-binding protein
VWFDWFDGDPVRLARRVASDPRVKEAKQDEGYCPRCQVHLVAEEFRDVGPRVYRCDQCFGLLVPGGAVALLAAQVPEREATSEPSVWNSLAAILQRMRE